MNIKAVAHLCLKTTDLNKTEAFYCGALGMEKRFGFQKAGEVIGFYLCAGNRTFVEVFLTDRPELTTQQHALSHFCFETEAIHEVRQRLLDHGYAPGEIILGADDAWQFWVTDPNGIDFEFQQYTSASSQFSGRDAVLD